MAFQSQLEPGFRTVPITPGEAAASIRICVIVRETTDPASGHFLLLRQTQDARVLLGAVTDASGRIHDWVELWYQNVEDESLNATRDQHWQNLSRLLEESEPESHYSLPASQFQPVFLHPKTFEPQVAATPSGDSLSLCQDDRALIAAGLPAYGSSAARFCWSGESKEFFALNDAARAFPGAIPLPASDATISLNPSAAALTIRRFSPMAIDEYADVLGGKAWSGLSNSRKIFRLTGVYREFNDEAAIRTKGRHFLGTRHDIAGRLAETLFLKATLIRQCVRRVMEESKRTGLPLLNIDAGTFRVGLGTGESELPYCWSANVSLARPGESSVLNVPGSRTKYFTSRAAASVSIFRPEELGLTRKGRGNVRIRRIFSPADGGLVAEGTLVAPDRLPVGTNELLRLSLPLDGSKTFTLIGSIDPSMALAPGETGFRTIPMDLDKNLEQVVRSYEGTPFSQIPYEVIPPLSSPCDLYSLGVLALRTLFAGGTVSLAMALDAMLSLGRAIAAQNSDEPLPKAVEHLLESDPRWLESLGPQHLIKDAPEGLIPLDVWSPVLAEFVRFFPGIGSFSYCSDLAAAPTEAPHAIYSDPLSHLDVLLLRLRCLCLSNWKENNEVASLLASYLA